MFKNFLAALSYILLSLSPTLFAATLNDNGKISETKISAIVQVKSEVDIINAIQRANSQHLPVAIMGEQHSQGGQSLAANAIELNMLGFNKTLNIDTGKKQITVESGITWSDLQNYINPYHLAVKSMQSPNIFTVGGSLSVNAHGDDFRSGAVGNTIVGFHLVLANGNKLLVSPTNNVELWNAVRGGYGLFGVVTDVTLQLTDNNFLISHFYPIDMDHFTEYFKKEILKNNKVALFYAHLNISPNVHFLNDMYIITYDNTNEISQSTISLVNPNKWNSLLTPMFNISRYGKFGKAIRWRIEKHAFSQFYKNKLVTRNNAMEKPVRFASDYNSKYNVDWLQEYFIPLDNLTAFVETLRNIVLKNNINLLNVTIRYVPKEPNIYLSYAKNDCFAVVLYFNQDLSSDKVEQARWWTRGLIDKALALNGNYYLPYQNFATKEVFRKAYPGYKSIARLKTHYDPHHIFTNHFYQTYFN